MQKFINIPSNAEIEALHLKLAPSKETFDLVFLHSKAVHDIAQQLIDQTI